MRKLLLIFLILPALSFADEDVSQICYNKSTWAQAIAMKRVQGVPEDQVLTQLQREQVQRGGQPFPTEFAITLRHVITEIYSDQIEIDHIMNVVWLQHYYYQECMKFYEQ